MRKKIAVWVTPPKVRLEIEVSADCVLEDGEEVPCVDLEGGNASKEEICDNIAQSVSATAFVRCLLSIPEVDRDNALIYDAAIRRCTGMANVTRNVVRAECLRQYAEPAD